MSVKSIHDLEDLLSSLSINRPYLIPEIYVLHGKNTRSHLYLYKVFTRRRFLQFSYLMRPLSFIISLYSLI